MDANHKTCSECCGPRRTDGTVVFDPLYMRGDKCYECWLYSLVPGKMRGLEWTIECDCPKIGVPWLDQKSPLIREQARQLPCARRPR